MNTQSTLPRLGGRHSAASSSHPDGAVWDRAVGTLADQPAAAAAVSRVATYVALSRPQSLDARKVCAWHATGCTLWPSAFAPAAAAENPPRSRPSLPCVDSTVANALRQIEALRQTNTTVRNSVTRSANVSLADLDLSDAGRLPRRARAVGGNGPAPVRRACPQPDLSYQPNFAACVHDTLAGALTQANVLAAAKNTRTARRSAPSRRPCA